MNKREIIIISSIVALAGIGLYSLDGIRALILLVTGEIITVILCNYYDSKQKLPYKKVINSSFCILHNKFKDRKYFNKTGFTLPPEIELRLNSGIYSEKDIEQLVKMMMLKVGIPTGMMQVKTEWVFTPVNSKSAGTFQKHNPIKETITIKCKKSYNKDVILSILAHEVSHSFLDMHNISLPEIIDNEILTDTCAVYLGFGDIMKKGYEQFSTSNNSFEKVGYISVEEVNYIIKKMNAQRSFDMKNSSNKYGSNDRNKNNDFHEELLQEFEEIEKIHKSNLKLYGFLQKNISRVDILPEDKNIVDTIINEIEYVESQISELKRLNVLSTNDKDKTEMLLSKLIQWNKILRKYSVI